MLRVFLNPDESKKYFSLVKKRAKLSYTVLAVAFKVSQRTFRDWKKGVYRFPFTIATQVETQYGIKLPTNASIIDEKLLKVQNGRKGAIERYKKYGNPGTPEGRIKGGKISLITHERQGTKFKIRKSFPLLEESEELAEMVGLLLGDGGITANQIRVTLNSVDDQMYAQFIKQLMYRLFGEFPFIHKRKGNTLEVVISGKNLVQMLVNKGLVIGNKVKQRIEMPKWIYKRQAYIQAVLRGLFDTDGSVYLDKHLRNGKEYKSICLAYTSYSENLCRDIETSLKIFYFSPTISTKNRVMLRRKEEISRFFNEINPSNRKHNERFHSFLEA